MIKILILVITTFIVVGCGSSTVSENVLDDVNTSEETVNESNTTDEPIADEPIISYSPIDIENGKKEFLNNCATCHGSDAKGKTGPNIVGISSNDIENEIKANSAMVFLQGVILEGEARVISIYLNELKKLDNSDDPTVIEKGLLGKELYFDANLSLNRTISCASCHDAEHAYIDARFESNPVNGALSVGDDGVTLGGRNSPTVAYAKFIPDLFEFEDGSFIGGQFWDGRADNLKEQAKGPFTDSAEMMMPDAQSVVARVYENEAYVKTLQKLYGDTIFSDTEKAFDAIADAISKYEMTEEFAPFDSKYDRSKLPYYHVDHYEMTEQEKLGYSLFFSDKTHCRKCHTTSSETESSIETFTNSNYENIGVPKNIEALIYRDGNSISIDLGLGGVLNRPEHYGKFKVPTLRNVAVTSPYMSNGVFKELKTVIKYFLYMAGHDYPVNPETGEPWQAADVNSTINHETLKTLPNLTEEEIDALESFLRLLTDKKYEDLF